MESMNKCPGCSQHCDRNNLQCSKGAAIYNGEITPDSARSHDHPDIKHRSQHGRNHHGHGHRHPAYPTGSLAELLAKCGHRLFHGGDEAMFTVLTEEESATLKKLLTKLISN